VDQVSVAQAQTSSLRLTEHPLQRCGAWAATVLAGCERVEQVTTPLLDGVIERIVGDVAEAAVAGQGSGAYDWWKVLFALYPNSKPTHARREKDRVALSREVTALFAPDDVEGPVRACTFCGQPSGVLWAKSTLPMFDSIRALNTLPPGTAGWPVCRGCRVALWALPYGAWLTAGSATALMCDNPQVERQFVSRNVRRAGRIRQLGFEGLPATAGPEAVTLQALREHASDAPAATSLWMFKNDNQEPWLRVSGTRTGVARFVHRMLADPDCAKGWRDLRRTLERRDRQGRATVDGATAAARLLFDREGERSDRLPTELYARSGDVEKVSWLTLMRWRALCRLYTEVMYEMDPDRIKPVADLLSSWIAQESHRGRFNLYRRAAGSGYELHKLLMTAGARMLLDGRRLPIEPEVLGDLLANGSQGWRERTLLFFEVIEALHDKKVAIGTTGGEAADEDDTEVRFDESEEYA
jgi:CRISPR-associated protein Cst1